MAQGKAVLVCLVVLSSFIREVSSVCCHLLAASYWSRPLYL